MESMTEYRGGYKKLIVWQNAALLRRRIYEITSRFPRTEVRRVSQMRDAARSTKQNIQEGYQNSSLKKYIQALTISQGSLGELSGDIDDCHEDGLLTEEEFHEVDAICGKTNYLFTRLIQSLRAKVKEGTWRNFRDLP